MFNVKALGLTLGGNIYRDHLLLYLGTIDSFRLFDYYQTIFIQFKKEEKNVKTHASSKQSRTN
jgi:hypothetical protein